MYIPWLKLLLGFFVLGALWAHDDFKDWQPNPKESCGGHYVPPELTQQPDDEIHVSAQTTDFDQPGRLVFEHQVRLDHQEHHIEAEHAEVVIDPGDRSNIHSVHAQGNVRYLSHDLQIWADAMDLDVRTSFVHLIQTRYRLYPFSLRGTARQIRSQDNRQNLIFEDAQYTTCPPGNNSWSLSAGHMVLNRNKETVVLKHAVLRLFHVPVFYVPHLSINLNKSRKSGWLFPHVSQSSDSGIHFSIPYYFNLAPHYDLLITPKIIQQRGLGANTLFRYSGTQDNSHLQVNALLADRHYRYFRRKHRIVHPNITEDTDPRLRHLTGTHRHAFSWQHQHAFSPQWMASVDWNSVSDDNYFADFGNPLSQNATDRVHQRFEVTHDTSNLSARLNVEHNQRLHAYAAGSRSELYSRLPQLEMHTTQPWPWAGLMHHAAAESTYFSRPRDPNTQLAATQGWRNHLRTSHAHTFPTPWVTVTPLLGLDITHYDLRLGPTDRNNLKPDTITRTVPMYQIDAESTYKLEQTVLGLSPWLEPHVMYLYVPYRNQNNNPVFDTGQLSFSQSLLFRDNRFTGFDRLGDAHQLSAQITSRLMDQVAYEEWLRLSLGQIFYFKDRQVTLCDQSTSPTCLSSENPYHQDRHSGLIGEVNTQFPGPWSSQWIAEWHPSYHTMMRYSFNVSYHNTQHQKIANVGHQYLRSDPPRQTATSTTPLRQSYLSTYWPLARHWHALGRWQHNHAEHYNIDLLAGLEYDTCCLSIQLVGGRTRNPSNSAGDSGVPRYQNALYFQLMLKGLSSITLHQTDRRLREAIEGYPTFEQRDHIKN